VWPPFNVVVSIFRTPGDIQALKDFISTLLVVSTLFLSVTMSLPLALEVSDYHDIDSKFSNSSVYRNPSGSNYSACNVTMLDLVVQFSEVSASGDSPCLSQLHAAALALA